MRHVLAFTAYASLTALTACASIVEGSKNEINVTTVPPSNATCSLTNARGTYRAYTPNVVSVKRSKTDLNVVCISPDARGHSIVESDVEAWAFGNLIIGGLIGLGVDWGTGAAYTYPEKITVPLSAGTAYAPAEAAATTYDQSQPYSQPIAASPAPAYVPDVITPAPAGTQQYYPYIPPSQLAPITAR